MALEGKIRGLQAGELEALCKALAETNDGLTGSEIGSMLAQSRNPDPEPTATKWRRLFAALAEAQNKQKTATPILNFVYHALAPARYVGHRGVLEHRRNTVNVVLAFAGVEMRDDGQFYHVATARTLGEAEQRASRLRATLQARSVHPDVIAFCKAELLADNYFHAVQEASKSVAEKIRGRTGLVSDGAKLADEAFSGSDPILRLNGLRLESETSEQSGFLNLVKGLFGTFRNPTAHAPRTAWKMSEEDALDLFSLASYAHRRIERAERRA